MTMTSEDEDFILSLELSLQLNEEHEYHESLLKLNEPSVEEPVGRSVVSHSSRKDLSVVDKFWELHDPNPDVHSLFVEFNKAYFYGKLDQVAVRWSWRMTLCAGLCQYEGKGGLCTVKLSEPLLKLRPRKDLVETLLHEMIHAYLFVTNNNKDHNAHGPEFHKHMDRINKASGANITVFHNFHGEVDNYRTHWWRCNGPCQHRMPFFGVVKRAMNRPPSERDPWWADHQRKCGGSFTKIREPEPKSSKGKRKDSTLPAKNAAKKPKLADGADIRTLLVSSPSVSKPAASVSASQSHQSKHPKHVSSFPGIMTKLPSNVHTLSQHAIDQQRSQVALYSGKGHTLGGCSTKSRLLEEASSRNESIVESSCVFGSVTRQMQDLQANEATSGSSTVSRSGQSANKCVTETEVKPTLQKPSRSTQPTLKDFLVQKKPAERTSRKSSAAKMKFIRELFSSDSDSDDDCIITTDIILEDQGKCTEKLGEASTSSSLNSVDIGAAANVSIGNGLALVECPACTHFVEGRLINSHLDECLRPDD